MPQSWVVAADPPVHDLEALGWLQFQRLCDVLLERCAGVPADAWTGEADGLRWAVAPEGLGPPLVARALPGPTLVLTRFRRRGTEPLPVEVPAPEPSPASLVLLTTVPSSSEAEPAAAGHELPPADVAVLGPAELGAAIAARPDVRLALPSVLGVVDAATLVDEAVAGRSTLDLPAAAALARVFVPTRAYARAVRALAQHRFAVLTGPPETGKTAIARMLALARMTDGWEAHECTAPEQVFARFDVRRRQLFVADDAFGSTEYRPDAAERWARDLDRVLARLDERHELVWTSRPAPLRAGLRRLHRERGLERFPLPGEVQVDAAALDVEEKVLILFRHARAAEVGPDAVRLLRAEGRTIVEHPHFTPERIRRFVAGRLPELAIGDRARRRIDLVDAIQGELERPTAAMATSFGALEPEHRAVLVAMLDAPGPPVHERDLTHALRRHHPGGLSHPPVELVDRLADHFVRVL